MSAGTDFEIKRAVDPKKKKKRQQIKDNEETCKNNMELQKLSQLAPKLNPFVLIW